MRVLVVGAGAMGCLYGAALHRAGCVVTLVDVNAEHIAAINARGLELERRSGTELLPIPACQPGEVSGTADLVLLFTKTFHTASALSGIQHAIGPETYVLTLQNGLGNAEAIAGFVPRERVMVGVSMLPSDYVGPGRVRSHGDGGTKLYHAFGGDGAMPGKVAALLSEGDLPATTDPAVLEVVWSKAIFNAAMNPLCALTRRTPGFFFAKPVARDTIRTVVEEGVAAARANGVMVNAEPIHALTLVSMTDHANHEASMLQDVKHGRPTEVDAINGAIVRAGEPAGSPCPVTKTLWRPIKLEDAKLLETG
ncbi:MAG: 2-dehydropantoate 2-reductase [Sphingomonadaceae bacterium]|nr:2-dehydropantoate 2-reductase [Sphingomonadaceae bacterium]